MREHCLVYDLRTRKQVSKGHCMEQYQQHYVVINDIYNNINLSITLLPVYGKSEVVCSGIELEIYDLITAEHDNLV